MIAWPTGLKPSSVEWSLRPNIARFRSRLSGEGQSVELPGARWAATVTFDKLEGDQARLLRAFLASASGAAGFYLPMFDQETPAGTATSGVTVNGASQTGKTLTVSGLTSDTLLAGDYIQVGDHLYILTADNSGGDLSIEPALRTSPNNGEAVTTSLPSAAMEFADDQQAAWSVSSPVIYGFSFSCIEVINV